MLEEKSEFNPDNTGILLISHGSRLPIASETITRLAEMYEQETDLKVGVAYMEIHEPNIPDALDILVKDTNIDTVIAVPVFLSHGMHTTRDIPKILRLKDEDSDEVSHHHSHEDHNEGSHHHHSHEGHNEGSHHHSHDLEKINFDGKIIYTEPLGADPLVLEIIKKRVENALNQ